MSSVIALIPARGGSKGIPRKNLVEVAGRPLIAFTIEAAKAVSRIDAVFVSSDDSEVLDVATAMGCSGLRRPPGLATDQSTAVEVVDHFLEFGLDSAEEDTVLLYLQPTSPFRNDRHIDEALQLLDSSPSRSVVSVARLEKSPYKAFTLAQDGTLLSLFDQKLSNANRQQLPQTFIPNGAIYGFTIGAFRRERAFPSNGSTPYVMDARAGIDVDTAADLEAVREMMEQQRA